MSIIFDKTVYNGYINNDKDCNKEFFQTPYNILFQGYIDYLIENPNDKCNHGRCFEKNVREVCYINGHKVKTFDKELNLIKIHKPLTSTSGDPIDIKFYDEITKTLYIGSAKCLGLLDEKLSTIPFTKTEIHAASSKAESNLNIKNYKIVYIIASNQMVTMKTLKEIYEEYIENNDNVSFKIILSAKKVYDNITDKMKTYASEHKIEIINMEVLWNEMTNIISQYDYDIQKYLDNMNSDYPLVSLRKPQLNMVERLTECLLNSVSKKALISAQPRFGKTIVALTSVKNYFMKTFNTLINKTLVYQTNFPGIFEDLVDEIYKVFKPNEVNVITDNGSNGNYDETKLNIVLMSSQFTANKNGIKTKAQEYLSKADFYIFDEAHIGIDTDIQKKVRRLLKKKIPMLLLSGTPFTDFLGKIDYSHIFTFSLTEMLEMLNEGLDTSYKHFPLPFWMTFDYQKNVKYDNNYNPDSIKELFNENNASYALQFFIDFTDSINNGINVSKKLDDIHNDYPYVWDIIVDKLYPRNFILFFNSKEEMNNAINAIKRIPSSYRVKVKSTTSDINSSADAVKDCNNFFDNNINGDDICYYCAVGQLTTGVTLTNCHGVIELNDGKSATKIIQSYYRANNPHKDRNGNYMPFAFWINISNNNMLEMFCELNHKAIMNNNSKMVKDIKFFKKCVTIYNGGEFIPLSYEEVEDKINEYICSKTHFERLVNNFSEWGFSEDDLNGIYMECLDKYDLNFISDKNKGLQMEFKDEITGVNNFEKIIISSPNPNYNTNAEKTTEEIEKEKKEKMHMYKILAFLNKFRSSQGHILKSLQSSKNIEKLEELKNGDIEESFSDFMEEEFEGMKRFNYYFPEDVFQQFGTYKKLSQYISNFIDLKKWQSIYYDVISIIIESIKNNETIDITPLFADKERVKNLGEVFTPINMVCNILDTLPKNIWSDKNSTFLDPAMGTGIFHMEIKRRLMNGLKEEFPDENEREKYIEENMLYGIELDKKNYILSIDSVLHGKNSKKHFVCHDALTFDYNQFDVKEFTAIVGNPPYQGMCGKQKKSIFHFFVDKAIELKPKYFSFIIPGRWLLYASDVISSDWIKEKIQCNHFKELHYFENSKDCFKTVNIPGSIIYFMYDKNYNGKCNYFYYHNNKIENRVDYLDYSGNGDFIKSEIGINILNKCINDNFKSFESVVAPKHFFDKNDILGSNWKGYSKIKNDDYSIRYYATKKVHGDDNLYISYNQVPRHSEYIDRKKIFIPKLGSQKTILNKPFISEEKSACSYSFIYIGYDKEYSDKELNNILSYIKTKFFRFLISLKKSAIDCSRKVYKFVPIQDFNEEWSDEKLYKKYNLSDEEIKYIEDNIEGIE